MRNLIIKILVFSLLFLSAPILVAGVSFNINFGPQTYEDSGVPVILPRVIWENSPDLKNLLDWYPSSFTEVTEDKDEKNKPPDYSSVERIIIHDMGCDIRQPGCNNKNLSPIIIIQNIYRYQTVTRGWGDIGYHYIIDYWGNIYEGRYGGNGVRGAHTYYDRKCNNFNVGSIGILLMGNYEKTELPEPMYRGLIRLVAWLISTNGLDPEELNHVSEIWHSPKKGSDCDLSRGGLTATYVGPVVVGHGDIEEGNSDPGLVNLARVRKEASELYLKYKNYTYTARDDSRYYTIEDGIKKELSSQGEFSSLTVLNQNQLDIFPSLIKHLYSDGMLVKSSTRNRVYLIEGNKRRPIFSERLFNIRRFNWSEIKILSDRDLASYSLGSPLVYPDGVLIKGDGPEVYLVENGRRKHISSAILFNRMGFKWRDIISMNQSELLAHPLGEKVLFSDDTLIKEEKSPPVYLVKNKERHWIKTLNAFLGLGYKWKDVVPLSLEEISYYTIGTVIEATGDILKLEKEEEPTESHLSIQAGEPASTQRGEPQFEGLNGKPDIRIGIYEVPTGESTKIRANGPYEVYKNGILLANKKANEIIAISYSKTDFYRFLPASLAGGSASESVIFEIISYEDRPEWNPELNDNHFRGIIEIKYSPKSEKLWVINELSLEDYLKGVAEALNNDSSEYLKAFIVAARSYTLFHIQNGGKVTGEIFHLKNWSFDQLYKGHGFEERAPNISRAVEETKGLIATYNDKPIRGVYSSDSGGVTKGACEVFKGVFCNNENYAYLNGGVKDPEGTVHNRTAIIASHGVGMSSVGARRLAEMGKSFEEILKYYYLGIEVEKVY